MDYQLSRIPITTMQENFVRDDSRQGINDSRQGINALTQRRGERICTQK